MVKHVDSVAIGWSRGRGIISSAIRKFDKSYYNHVFWAFRFPDVSLIYESHVNHGVQLSPFSQLVSAAATGAVDDYEMRTLDMYPEERAALWANCARLHGKGYDVREILIYMAWIKCFGRRGDAPDTLNKPDKYTCNEFIVATGKHVVPILRHTDYKYTPETLYRLVMGKTSLDRAKEKK